MTESTFRWGILGLGNIARSFANGLRTTPGARLVAGASNSRERAEKFRAEYDLAVCYDNYSGLINDPDIDAIYIATRHPDHARCALDCIAAGKPILVEKPFTINAREAESIVAAARAKNVFCMEAMWTRFMPLMGRVRELLADGAIGPVRMLHADFGFKAEMDAGSRLFDPALGGGALLDVGVYPLSLASMVLGKPSEVAGMAHIGATGVDEHGIINLKYPGGALATVTCSVQVKTPHLAHIIGETGRIDFHTPWWIPRALTLHREGKPKEIIDMPFGESGYAHEALEVMKCVREGRQESSVLPLEESIEIMRTMDALRAQWGVRYPSE